MHTTQLASSNRPSRVRGSFILLAAILAPGALLAGSTYKESGSGDFSDVPSSPTGISISPGSNFIYGSAGNPSGTPDRDFFTFTIPAGHQLSSIEVLSGTTSAGGGNRSFIGIISGDTFGATVPSGVAGAATLLGYHHYDPSEIGTDILGKIGQGNISAPPIGFTPPLKGGTYSVWIQETAPGSAVNYGFKFTVPDSNLGIWAGLGFAGLLVAQHRRKH